MNINSGVLWAAHHTPFANKKNKRKFLDCSLKRKRVRCARGVINIYKFKGLIIFQAKRDPVYRISTWVSFCAAARGGLCCRSQGPRYLRSKISPCMRLNHSCSRKYLFYENCRMSGCNKPEWKFVQPTQKLALLFRWLVCVKIKMLLCVGGSVISELVEYEFIRKWRGNICE